MDHRHPGRRRWRTVGFYLTAAWLLLVVAVSAGDGSHPLFDYIFIVPLAGWIAAVLVDRINQRRRGGPREDRIE